MGEVQVSLRGTALMGKIEEQSRPMLDGKGRGPCWTVRVGLYINAQTSTCTWCP